MEIYASVPEFAIDFGNTLRLNRFAVEIIGAGRKRQTTRAQEPPPTGFHLLYDNVPQKGANTMRSFEERQIVDIPAAYIRHSLPDRPTDI